MLEETSCPDCAVLAKGSWSFWEPLVAPLQLISSPRWCPASTTCDQRLSSPALGCLGSVLLFCSLNLFIASCNQSPSRREPKSLEITLSLLLLTAATSQRFNPSHSSLLAFLAGGRSPPAAPALAPQPSSMGTSPRRVTSTAKAKEPGSLSGMAWR